MRSIWIIMGLLIGTTNLFALTLEETLTQARAAYHEANYKKAERLYQSLIRSAGDDTQYRFELGMVYLAQERYNLAQVTFERVLKLDERHLLAHYNLAKIYTQSNKREEAVAIYRYLIDAYAYFPPAYLNLANILLVNQEYAEAKELYQNVLMLDSSLVEAYVGLMILAFYQGEHEEAKEYFKQWISLMPTDERIAYWQATLADE